MSIHNDHSVAVRPWRPQLAATHAAPADLAHQTAPLTHQPNEQGNTDSTTWFEPPDEVDAIQAAERFKQTEDFLDAALQWGVNDADILAEIADRFTSTALYEQEFNRWMARQTP